MSRFKKLINIIYYLMSICSLLFFLLILTRKNYLSQRILNEIYSDEIIIVIAGFACIMLLVSLLKLLASILQKSNEKYLYLFDDDGDVCISDTAIENTIKNSLRQFEEIVEYTVKVKIKNEKERSKVKVKIKCGLDEALCKAKGYYDYLNDIELEEERKNNENRENKSADEKLEKKELISEKDDNVEKSTLNEDSCSDKTQREINLNESALTLSENSKGENEIEEASKNGSFAPEILSVMNVISDKSNESVELSGENLQEDSRKENIKSRDKMLLGNSIDELCSNIQKYLHSCMQEFLSNRIDRLDIKFYDVKAKNRTHNREKNSSKASKNKRNKKRVN